MSTLESELNPSTMKAFSISTEHTSAKLNQHVIYIRSKMKYPSIRLNCRVLSSLLHSRVTLMENPFIRGPLIGHLFLIRNSLCSLNVAWASRVASLAQHEVNLI